VLIKTAREAVKIMLKQSNKPVLLWRDIFDIITATAEERKVIIKEFFLYLSQYYRNIDEKLSKELEELRPNLFNFIAVWQILPPILAIEAWTYSIAANLNVLKYEKKENRKPQYIW